MSERQEKIDRFEGALVPLAEEAAPYEALLKKRKIRQGDQESFDAVAVALRTVETLRKEAKEKLDSHVHPLQSVIKGLRKEFKRWDLPLNNIAKHCRRMLADYTVVADEAAQARAEKRAKKTGVPVEDLVRVEKEKGGAVGAAGLHTRSYVRGRVTDKAKLIAAVAAGKLPTEVLQVNSKELNAWARLNPKHGEQHGIQVYMDTIVALSS